MFKTKQLFFQFVSLVFFLVTIYWVSINFTQPVVYQLMPERYLNGMLGIPLVLSMMMFALAVYFNRMAATVDVDKARHNAERKAEKTKIEASDAQREIETLNQKITTLESALEKAMMSASAPSKDSASSTADMKSKNASESSSISQSNHF